MKNCKITVSSAVLATIVSIMFVVIITILAEISPDIKGILATMFGHHWVGKSVLVAVVWFLVARFARPTTIAHPVTALYHTTIWSSIAIIGYYIIHHFVK